MKVIASLVSFSALALLTFGLGGIATARAAVIGFDDLPSLGGVNPITDYAAIPNPYGGFVWQNFNYTNSTLAATLYGINGYVYGAVSPENIANNNFAQPATVSRVGGSRFTFDGAYFTGAWNDNLNIELLGYRDGGLIYDQTIVVSTTSPTFFTFNYQSIDSLTFKSFGGTPHGYVGQGAHFVMDNFTFAVPEPSSRQLAILSGIVLLSLALLTRCSSSAASGRWSCGDGRFGLPGCPRNCAEGPGRGLIR